MMDETMEKLTGIFREFFDNPELNLTPETTANDVDGWDSFSHVALIMTIELKFKVSFSDKESFGFNNVGAMVDCIREKLSQGEGK
jgi:acyl carrier protein